MKHKLESFFLAFALFTAAPAFADRIYVDLMNGAEASVSMQGSPHHEASQDRSAFRNLGMSTSKEDESRIEFNRPVRMSDFSKDGRISNFEALLHPAARPKNPQIALLDLSSRHGVSLGLDARKAPRKNHEIDSTDPSAPLVATPEPGSGALLLLGWVALALIVYPRNTPQNAI